MGSTCGPGCTDSEVHLPFKYIVIRTVLQSPSGPLSKRDLNFSSRSVWHRLTSAYRTTGQIGAAFLWVSLASACSSQIHRSLDLVRHHPHATSSPYLCRRPVRPAGHFPSTPDAQTSASPTSAGCLGALAAQHAEERLGSEVCQRRLVVTSRHLHNTPHSEAKPLFGRSSSARSPPTVIMKQGALKSVGLSACRDRPATQRPLEGLGYAARHVKALEALQHRKRGCGTVTPAASAYTDL